MNTLARSFASSSFTAPSVASLDYVPSPGSAASTQVPSPANALATCKPEPELTRVKPTRAPVRASPPSSEGGAACKVAPLAHSPATCAKVEHAPAKGKGVGSSPAVKTVPPLLTTPPARKPGHAKVENKDLEDVYIMLASIAPFISQL